MLNHRDALLQSPLPLRNELSFSIFLADWFPNSQVVKTRENRVFSFCVINLFFFLGSDSFQESQQSEYLLPSGETLLSTQVCDPAMFLTENYFTT